MGTGAAYNTLGLQLGVVAQELAKSVLYHLNNKGCLYKLGGMPILWIHGGFIKNFVTRLLSESLTDSLIFPSK